MYTLKKVNLLMYQRAIQIAGFRNMKFPTEVVPCTIWATTKK